MVWAPYVPNPYTVDTYYLDSYYEIRLIDSSGKAVHLHDILTIDMGRLKNKS